jgi:hypothetical protein
VAGIFSPFTPITHMSCIFCFIELLGAARNPHRVMGKIIEIILEHI